MDCLSRQMPLHLCPTGRLVVLSSHISELARLIMSWDANIEFETIRTSSSSGTEAMHICLGLPELLA